MWSVVVAGLFIAVANGLGFVNQQDKASLTNVFESALSKPKDVPSLAYGIAGLKLLEQPVPNEETYCNYVKSNVKLDDLESVFAAADIARRLQSCKLDNTAAMTDALNAGITDAQTAQNLFYIVTGLKFLTAKVDNAKVIKSLAAAVKKDDSVQSLAYAFHAASRLTGDLKPFIDRIEDVVAQADEVDGTMLQFEGGVSITANAISGIYALGDKMNKTAPMKPEQAVKFANYLLSRKSVQLPRPAYHLVRAIQFMNKNKHQVPVSISLESSLSVHPGSPNVVVRVCNMMGEAVPVSAVTAQSATHHKSQGVVLSKAALSPVAGQPLLHQLNFLAEDKQEGFYSVLVGASSSDKKLIGLETKISVKVLSEVSVHNVEVSVTDRDQKSTPNALNVQFPNKIPTVVEADYHQKLVMKFGLRNKKTQKPIKVQQAFIIFRNIETKQEITFVAEPDSTDAYVFDADLLKSAADFDYLSGKYYMILVVGDAVLSNSFQWSVADLTLKFPPHDRPVATRDNAYKPKKTIKHLFREPEKRPSRAISSAFTLLVLAPFGLMLVLWLAIGINFSNFLVSIYTLGFHAGLAGIFALYYMFWTQLNMFQTVRYLTLVGLFTFITGNAMLRRMAERRMEKKKTQ